MTYLLSIILTEDIEIIVGKLGKLHLKKGHYLYIGSAKRNFDSRINRHLSKNKKIHWHIDYLLILNQVRIDNIWRCIANKECHMAYFLNKENYRFISNFGSSDCDCQSHLFFIDKNEKKVKNLIIKKGFKNASKNYL